MSIKFCKMLTTVAQLSGITEMYRDARDFQRGTSGFPEWQLPVASCLTGIVEARRTAFDEKDR